MYGDTKNQGCQISYDSSTINRSFPLSNSLQYTKLQMIKSIPLYIQGQAVCLEAIGDTSFNHPAALAPACMSGT